MDRRTKRAMRGSGWVLVIVLLNCLLPNLGIEEAKKIHAQTPEQIPPPIESEYAGLTKCAACHYKQYENWKTTRHAKAFDYLPTRYRNNAECLQCHTSRPGRGAAGQTLANNVPGVSCEECHGPGREHANLALTFVARRAQINEDTLKSLRSKIQRTAVTQCIRCHVSMAHKPHPEFDREAPSTSSAAN